MTLQLFILKFIRALDVLVIVFLLAQPLLLKGQAGTAAQQTLATVPKAA